MMLRHLWPAAAETLAVLTQCGDDLSRDNIMRQAASLKNYRAASCCRAL
jgi:hypothetical protein